MSEALASATSTVAAEEPPSSTLKAVPLVKEGAWFAEEAGVDGLDDPPPPQEYRTTKPIKISKKRIVKPTEPPGNRTDLGVDSICSGLRNTYNVKIS